MRILVDMNLSPDWVEVLSKAGHEATHWSSVGQANAPDSELVEWARNHDHVIMTHDLDFGAVLAVAGASSPSVVQIRTGDPTPANIAEMLIAALEQFSGQLASGVFLTIDERRARARILPLR